MYILRYTISYSFLYLFQADASLELERRDFIRAGLEYVCLIQEVQERKKFEFVETVSVIPILSFVLQLVLYFKHLFICFGALPKDGSGCHSSFEI